MSSPLPFASYGIILADPPWLFDLRSEAGEEKSPQSQYDCMPTDEICGLRETLGLDWICAPDCVLVMWTTFPMLARGDAHQVMRGWGFQPKTGGAWGKLDRAGKLSVGTGYWYRSAAEVWLLGTRGSPPILNRSSKNCLLDEGFLTDFRREHSRKPDAMAAMIERQFKGPYLELFGREQRDGWTIWGNETEKFAGAA